MPWSGNARKGEEKVEGRLLRYIDFVSLIQGMILYEEMAFVIGVSVVRCRVFCAFVLILFCPPVAARAGEAADCHRGLTQKIAPRPRLAVTGSEFARRMEGFKSPQRERAAFHELLSGNFPPFLRSLERVELRHEPNNGQAVRAVLCLMPDYLAIGSDEDFLRLPMDRYTATALARKLGFVLPTKKVVDAIYAKASHRLKPQPLPPGPDMRSTRYYWFHNHNIKRQRVKTGHHLGDLIVGHKKDLVVTNRLARRPRRVAIYGWHRLNGQPIQPLSTVHGATYADYSHGVRLISELIYINGGWRSIYAVLKDPRLAKVLSEEGTIREIRTIMGVAPPTR